MLFGLRGKSCFYWNDAKFSQQSKSQTYPQEYEHSRQDGHVLPRLAVVLVVVVQVHAEDGRDQTPHSSETATNRNLRKINENYINLFIFEINFSRRIRMPACLQSKADFWKCPAVTTPAHEWHQHCGIAGQLRHAYRLLCPADALLQQLQLGLQGCGVDEIGIDQHLRRGSAKKNRAAR